ncbi:MAG: hypothetical protein ORN85_08790 [Sediminibacterium sp.]|nr:hypothetical protein [Sediminibacterium sp.]
MRTLLIFIVMMVNFHSFGQKSIFKWTDDYCEYESIFDKTKYTAIQLKNCHDLTYDLYGANSIDITTVFEKEDIKKLNIETLDNKFNSKYKILQSLDLPNTEYWKELRASLLTEMEQFYKIRRIYYQSFLDSTPFVLKNWFYQDSCLSKHANALIVGKDSLVKDWYELTSILVKSNCCPDRVWKEFNIKNASNNRFDYAKIYVTTFGWWNCALKYLERSNDKFDESTKIDTFNKLLIKTKKNCEEL